MVNTFIFHQIIQLELVSRKIGDNGNSNMPAGGFLGHAACYDGEHIWVVYVSNANRSNPVSYLVKINATTNKSMIAYKVSCTITPGVLEIVDIVLTGGHLWICNLNGITRINLLDMEEDKIALPYQSARAVCFDGSFMKEILLKKQLLLLQTLLVLVTKSMKKQF